MARSKRVTLRLQVTVPEDTDRRFLEQCVVTWLTINLDRSMPASDVYARVQQEDPIT